MEHSKDNMKHNSENHRTLPPPYNDYHQLEELYLQSTFDLPVSDDQSHQQSVEKSVKKTGYSVVACVKSKLLQRLTLIGTQLLETVTKDVSVMKKDLLKDISSGVSHTDVSREIRISRKSRLKICRALSSLFCLLQI